MGRGAGLTSSWLPLSAHYGVGRHRGADELLEGSFVDLLPFAEVDRTPHVPFQAGIEELLRVCKGGSASEGELYNLLIRFPCADDALMRPDGGSPPFPLLQDVGVGIVDELTEMSEGLPAPVPKFLDLLVDECRGRFHRVLPPTRQFLGAPVGETRRRVKDPTLQKRGKGTRALRNKPSKDPAFRHPKSRRGHYRRGWGARVGVLLAAGHLGGHLEDDFAVGLVDPAEKAAELF